MTPYFCDISVLGRQRGLQLSPEHRPQERAGPHGFLLQDGRWYVSHHRRSELLTDWAGLILFDAVSDYKKKIGYTGQFLIEPKAKEPTRHQYDYGERHRAVRVVF